MHILWISLGTTKTFPFNWYARWTFADGIRFPKSCAFNTPLYEQVRIFESFTCLICFCFGVSFIVLTEPFIHYDWVSYLIGFREFVVLVYWSTRNDVLLSALYLCSYFELKLTFVGVWSWQRNWANSEISLQTIDVNLLIRKLFQFQKQKSDSNC